MKQAVRTALLCHHCSVAIVWLGRAVPLPGTSHHHQMACSYFANLKEKKVVDQVLLHEQ